MPPSFLKKNQDRLLILGVAVLCTVGVGFVLYHHWTLKEKNHYSEHQTLLDTAYRASIQSYRLAMESFFYNSINTPQVLELFKQGVDARDDAKNLARGKLYRYLAPAYAEMKRRNLLQLHFHQADGTSFLRFHKPESFGDALFEVRPGVRICNTEKRIVQGFENGRALSGFRYIFPLSLEGRHLGSVEVSVTTKAILDSLKGLDPQREYACVLSRRITGSLLFADQKWLYSPAAIHADYMVEDANAKLESSPMPLSATASSLNDLLRARTDVQEAMQAGTALTINQSYASVPYTVSLLPILDIDNRLAGYLISYAQDQVIAKFRQEYFILLVYAALLLSLIFALVWRLRLRGQALGKAKQNLEAMNNALAEGVFTLDFDGRITMVNPAACAILGYDENALLGQDAHSLLHRGPEQGVISKTSCPFSLQVKQGLPHDGEEYFLTKDGRLLTVEVASRPVFHEKRAAGSVIAFHDITARKKIEAALRHSEEIGRQLTTAVEQSPVSVMITGPQGTIEYVNAKFTEKTGYSLAEAMGQNPRILKSGLMPDELYRNLWQTIKSGHVWKGELHNRRKDGTLYWESVSISPIRDDHGRITHFIALKEDITEQIRMEEELRENEFIQRTLMESLPVGVMIIDAGSKKIELVNPFAAALIGAEASQITGNISHSYLCPAETTAKPVGNAGQTTGNTDSLLIRADGSHIPVLNTIRKVPIKGQQKLLECFIDIRERKRVETALIAANKQLETAINQAKIMARKADEANQSKSAFLANMSHEIRTPMNAVLGMMHLALRTGLTDQQRDFIGKAEQSAKSLLGILNEILDFSKIEAGRLDLEQVEFSLHEVLDNLITVISVRLHTKDIEFIVAIHHDVPARLVGDPMRLGQVLINLAGNAAKFTETGEIRVTVTLDKMLPDNRVRLRFNVLDTGIGLDPVQIEGLFTPFTQADPSTTRQFGGTGLGLSISQRLVHLMGGEIQVESALGKGSLFSFEALFTIALEQQAIKPPALHAKRVLVADNRQPARRALVEHLLTLGMQYGEAASGAEAITAIKTAVEQNEPYDLVLLDQAMPVMDGIAAAEAIMAEQSLIPPPDIILLATLRQQEALADANKGRELPVLTKPVTLNTLSTLLHRLESRGEKPSPQPAGQKSGQERHFAKGRVLLVEDNDFNQLVAQGILENAGLDVTVAGNGAEAVSRVMAEAFDLVLMDIQMPVMDGFEATRRIRECPQYRGLPIIAMTAYATPEERQRIIAAGMDDHVAKPIDFTVLFTALCRWLAPGEGQCPLPFTLAATPGLPALETSDGQTATGGSTVILDYLALQDGLDRLRPLLKSCKPKQCATALEQMRSLVWPGHCLELLDKMADCLDHYDFASAQQLAASLSASLKTLEHQS